MNQPLNADQRAQVRSDLINLEAARLKINDSFMVNDDTKAALAAMSRTLQTLAIAAGAFDENGGQNG